MKDVPVAPPRVCQRLNVSYNETHMYISICYRKVNETPTKILRHTRTNLSHSCSEWLLEQYDVIRGLMISCGWEDMEQLTCEERHCFIDWYVTSIFFCITMRSTQHGTCGEHVVLFYFTGPMAIFAIFRICTFTNSSYTDFMGLTSNVHRMVCRENVWQSWTTCMTFCMTSHILKSLCDTWDQIYVAHGTALDRSNVNVWRASY